MPTNNPSVHYIDNGKLAPVGDHKLCENFWANIKAFHSETYGPDSAYNFAVCNEHGFRMEGRGWDRSSAANGQEDGVDYNPGSRACVMLVGGDDILSDKIHWALISFADEAYARGMDHPLKSHSDFVATSCCGDNGRALVAKINAGIEPDPPKRKKAKMHLYSTIDKGQTTYYREAEGILVPLEPAEAAVYYGAIQSGDVVVFALGGVLAALAFNAKTKAALQKVGV